MRRTILFLGLIALAGCSPDALVSVKTDKEKPAGPQTVWTVIADYVDAGDVTDSTKLELMVKRLRARGSIDDNAVEKFYSAFPGIKEKEIPITSTDSSKLRGI
jgi:hypothetical protein